MKKGRGNSKVHSGNLRYPRPSFDKRPSCPAKGYEDDRCVINFGIK